LKKGDADLKRFSLLILAGLLLFALACNKDKQTPDESEPSVPAFEEEPELPVNPDPPSPPPIDTFIPEDPPEYPDVELAADWTANDLTVLTLTYQNAFRGDKGETVLEASGLFPQTGIEGIDRYYRSCRDDFESMCAKWAEEAERDERFYYFNADYQVELNAGGLFSVLRTLHEYTGGVHGMYSVYCETFSVSSGNLLTLDDLFSVPQREYTERLLETVYAVIDQNPGDFHAEARELALTLFPYQTFTVTENGISLIYDVYNLAPYAMGPVRIDVPWGAVAEMFISEW
jgi:hypothetical protein